MLAFLLLFGIEGCAPGRQESYDVMTIADSIGIDAPYKRDHFFSADSESVFTSILNILDSRGAQIIVADRSSGVISWNDLGATFIPLSSQIQNQVSAKLLPTVNLTNWTVHATANIHSLNKGTELYLHLVGRGVERDVVFSDGSYEREFFKSIGGNLKKKQRASPIAIKSRTAVAEILENSGNLPTTYEDAFVKHFRNLPSIRVNDIRERGISKLYPVNQRMVWLACLDVITQSDVIAWISKEEMTVIFNQGISLPKNISGQEETQYFDVFIALNVEPRTESSSVVHMVFLSPSGFAPTRIPQLAQKTKMELVSEFEKNSHEFAAAMVADELFSQVATQLLYKDRWKDKFHRRYSTQ
jgi:hypothetical protein